MRKYLTMVVLLVAGFTAFAQQHSVRGTVVDSQGNPVVGMTVMEKGTQNGTTTDADGNYILNLSSQGGAVEFHALGYKTVTEQVAGRSVINVTAQEEAIALDAVVAIGYGTVRRRDLTTAVSTVSNEDMQLRPVTEASGFLQGKVAGVTVPLVANFYFDNIGILGRTVLESSATSTYNSRFVIIGMYTLFHCRLPRFLFGLPHAY